MNDALRAVPGGLGALRVVPGGATAAYRTHDWDSFWSMLFCPRCHCTKSEDVSVANPYTEACTDAGCACHWEEPELREAYGK